MEEKCILGCEARTRWLVSTRDAGFREKLSEPLEARATFGSSRLTAGGVRVRQCTKCHLAWQTPRLDPTRVKLAYGEMQDHRYVEETRGRHRSFRRCLQLLDRYPDGRPGQLLDVGCSTGIFLQLARDAGWNVLGLEPSEWLFRKAKTDLGDVVNNCTFEEAQLADESFDLVTLWDVLEHVVDPAAVLEKSSRVLRPGGLLVLNTPNVDSLIARAMGSKWPLLLREHLYYFSPDSLDELLTRSGLRILGTHLHFAFFGWEYVLHRLAQHGIPAVRLVSRLANLLRVRSFLVPLLLGELTVVARRESTGRHRGNPSLTP